MSWDVSMTCQVCLTELRCINVRTMDPRTSRDEAGTVTLREMMREHETEKHGGKSA